jgi:hypothetical protein
MGLSQAGKFLWSRVVNIEGGKFGDITFVANLGILSDETIEGSF